VGISVSRVGGNAQIKSMKKVAGVLRLNQAQFRELQAFAKFGSDLDAATKAVLDVGERNVELLKQYQYQPMRVEHQIALIFCGTNGLLKNIPVDKIKGFKKSFIITLELEHKPLLEKLKSGVLDDEAIATITKVASEVEV
jgi:F-type H+-transporting ATPase subunit alpha